MLASKYSIRAYPVEYSQIHAHQESGISKVDALGEVGEELVVERLHPVSITALD